MAAPTLDWAPPEAATAQAPQPDTWQPPEATASWAPPEAQSQEQAWTPPEAEQSPLETGLRTIAQDLGSLAMTGVSGLGRYFEDLSGVANQVVPGLGDVLDYAPQSALFQALAPVAEDLRQETETVYNPDAQRNPIAATVGGGIGQALGMVPMIATGGTPLVLGAAAASGYGQGSQTAEDLGVQNPAGRMALGAGFGAAETLVERLGGIGAGPVRAGAKQIVESLGKSTLKTIGSEAIEEPITGALQDTASLVAASTVADPNRPGFTITGQPIAPLLPNSPEYWKSRGMEAIGGAAGGTVFAGLGALGRLTQPQTTPTDTPTIEGDLLGTPITPTATAPTEAQVIANGTTYAYDTTQLTADQIQTLAATGSLQEYIDQGMVRNVFAPPPLPIAATPATSPGTPDPGNVGSPPPPVVDTPGPTVQEAQQTNLASKKESFFEFDGTNEIKRQHPDYIEQTGKVIDVKSQMVPDPSGKPTPISFVTIETQRGAKVSVRLQGEAPRSLIGKSVTAGGRDLEDHGNGIYSFMNLEGVQKFVISQGPTVAQAQQTLGDIGNVGSQFAGATTVGRAGPAPLPRDPEGNYDLLNHLNENPIRAPRKGTEGAAAAEYDWREAGDFDPAYRSRIMQEGAPNIDQRAQEAYDLGFIPEPTPQALADEVRSAIAKRNQQRRQGPGQSRLLNEQEQAQVQFEQTQERLATTGQPIDLDQLAPGDTLRIGGQPVTVADIEYDEDGYTTRALLRTPTGTVRVTPESNLRADAPTTAPAPRTLGDINAELAAWADQTIAQGQGQMSMGLDPTLLAAYTVKGAQLIAEGFTTFGRWSKEMLRRFGAAVRQYLAEAWQSAKKNSQVGARANLNPNARLSARPPTFAEALEGQTRQSQFGERVQADDRLTDPLRTAPVSTYAIQGEQQALDQANALIRQLGLEGATASFQNNATLPMPVRIAGLMQAALQYDARAALALRQGNEAGSAAADAATEAAIQAKASLEFIGNESGRNLAMFRMWARMSPDGQLRRLDRNLAKAARDTIRGDQGVTPDEVNTLVIEETNSPEIDEMIEQITLEGPPITPVNLRTGAPIAQRSLFDTFLGGLETTARAISESTTIQRAVEAIDNVLKALSGKLFADPLLITPIGQAVLRTTRTLLLQGTKISQAIADAIAVVRTRTPIPPQDVAPLTQAVTSAIVKEVVRPILRKLAFDPNYNKREATKDMLAIGIGVMEAGRLADAVIAKRPKIAKAAQDIVRQRVMRRLSDKPRSKSRKQKLPAIIDTLVLAAGAGFINERTFLDAWDKKHPLPKLTPADRVRLRQMAAAINLLPEGILRQAEAIKFLNEVALIEGIPTTDLIVAAWYANILSGVSTQGVNVAGGAWNIALRTLAIGLISPADFSKLNLGILKGVAPGIREGIEVARTGNLLKVGKMDDMQKAAALELMVAQGGPRGLGQWIAYLMSVGGLTRYVFRAMGAADAVFWYSAQEGMAHAAVSRTLRKAGGLKPGTPAFNAEFIRQLGGDEKQFLADFDQARTELKAAGVPVTSAAVNRRAYEIRVQRRSLDIRAASVRFADRITMQNQPEGSGALISTIIGALQKFRVAGVPIFIPIAPFNRVISNFFEGSLDFAGVGILRGILGSHLSEVRDPKRRQFDNLERAERFGAGVIGLGFAGFVLSMAMAVKDQDDDEVPFMIYAMGPPDPTRRGLMPKNWRPFSMKVGQTYYGFAETPLGPLLGAVGGWMDSVRYGKTENQTLTERMTLAFLHAVNSFNSLGALSTIKEVGEVFEAKGGVRAFQRTVLSPVAGFIPAQGMMRDMAPLFDNTKISDGEVFGSLVKDIPVLKSYGRPALNVLGEEIKIGGIPVVRRFAAGKEPDANISFIQKHKLRISALERTIEIGQYLPKPERIAKGLEDSDRRRALGMTAIENGVMTPAQQYAFTKAQGEAIKGGLERLRKSTANRPSSPQTTALLQKQLDRTIQAARIHAMRQIVSELR
jgi:hypothetical protein